MWKTTAPVPSASHSATDMSDDANASTAAPMDAVELARTWEREQASTSRGSLDARPRDGPNASGATSPSTPGGGAHDTVTLAWRDLRYTVYPNGKKKPAKEVLKGISGAALPNHVIALMGPTGSGKTSLLNVLSGRVPAGGDLAGDVNVNGKPRGEDFAQRVAYVMQEELLFAFLSVRETFALHARLRLPPSVPDADKLAIVERLVAELGLVAVADSPVGRVGGFPRGLSGGERKRCNIGVEMVRDPSALFLDEPTSGLDSFQAQNVMSSLRDLATNARTVMLTIHQPRSSIFAMFDQLMLIADGRLTYIGDAHAAVGYFETLSFKCPTLSNPADFFLDVTSLDARGETRANNSRARVRFFADEAERRGLGVAAFDAAMATSTAKAKATANTNANANANATESGRREKIASSASTGAGWLAQFALLLRRANQCLRRDLLGVGITVFLDVVYALLLSALFRGVGDDQEGVQNRLGCLFFVCLNLAYGAALPSINLFAAEKLIVIREQASGAYTTSAYYLSKLVAELPKLSSKLLFCVIVYWTVGLNPEPARFANFVAIILCEVLAAQAVGMVMATGMPIGAALALGPACITVFTLFGGIFLNMDSIPTGAGWIRWIDFLYYAFSALCANEFDDPDARFACAPGADARCLPDGRAVLELYSFEDVTVWTQIAAQLALAAGLQCLAFALLVRGTSRFLPLRVRSERDRRESDDESPEEEGASVAGVRLEERGKRDGA